MTVANGEVTRDVPLMPGGRRVLGHALKLGGDPLALLTQAREHGDVVRIRFGPFQVYVLNSPGAIRQALVGEARKLGKGLNFGRPRRLIGNGLVMSDGESHAIDEIERLLRVLLSELVARGITANVPGLAWLPARSSRRFGVASRRLRALLTDVIDGYRKAAPRGQQHPGAERTPHHRDQAPGLTS